MLWEIRIYIERHPKGHHPCLCMAPKLTILAFRQIKNWECALKPFLSNDWRTKVIISGLQPPFKDCFRGFLSLLHPFRSVETEPSFACCISGGLTHRPRPPPLKAEFILRYYKRKTPGPTFPLNASGRNMKKHTPLILFGIKACHKISLDICIAVHLKHKRWAKKPFKCFANRTWDNKMLEGTVEMVFW